MPNEVQLMLVLPKFSTAPFASCVYVVDVEPLVVYSNRVPAVS
ncbi:MAG: hypothetical protein NXI35_38305 [bacterium]|nr:hypothetical protein [bacterium]